MDAALAEFCAHGFSGASIQRIAASAGVTRSAIYRRYTDLHTLFSKVIDEQIATLEKQAKDLILTGDDPLQNLKRTMKAYCRFIVSPIPLSLQRIVIWEAASPSHIDMPRVPPLPTDLSDLLDSIILDAQTAKQIKPGPVELWRDVVLRLVAEGPRWQALASGEPWPEDRLQGDFDRMWPLFLAIAGTPVVRGATPAPQELP